MSRIVQIQIPDAATVEDLRRVLTTVINGLIDQINSQSITGNTDHNNMRITGVASPAQNSDAATKGYVDAAISAALRARSAR